MGRPRKRIISDDDEVSEVPTPKRRSPARSIKSREDQLIALAVDLAEKQLTEGTASSQVIAHYLKLGSTREKLEQKILDRQRYLLEAKTDSLKSAKKMEEMYAEAIQAMRVYNGQADDIDEDDE